MEPEKTYQYLEDLAEKLGVSIRYEDLSCSEHTAKSALCRVKGRYLYIMDTSKDLTERIRLLSQCLSQMDLEGIYIVPAIRELLERSRRSISFFLVLFLSIFFTHATAAAYLQVPGISNVHSNFSTGRYDINQLARMAQERGIEILIMTDHDLVAMTYGLPPFRHLFRYRKERDSVLKHGAESYFSNVENIDGKYPELLVIPGIKSAPFYFWTGSYFQKNLTAHNYNKQLIVLGLEDPGLIRGMPVINNSLSLRFTRELLPGVIFFAAAFVLTLLLLLWGGLFRLCGLVLAVASLLFLLNDHPFKSIRYDPYDGDPGIGPYQDLIDYVAENGGMTFWVMPDSASHQSLPPIILDTKPHAQDLLLSHGYTGLEVMYGDVMGAERPGNVWDQVLGAYCRGERRTPVFGISGSDYYFEGKSGMKMEYFQTIFLLKQKTKAQVYEALRSGRIYALRQLKGAKLRLDEFYVQGSNSKKSFSGQIASVVANHTPKVFCSIITEDHSVRHVELKIISDGRVVKSVNGKTPLRVQFLDSEQNRAGLSYYRVEVNDEFGNRIISNPIFVTFT